MSLEDLGYSNELEQYRKEKNLDLYDIGRVTSEHRERYTVRTAEKEFDAEIIGNLRFSAQSRSDFPAVGDWVAFTQYDENKALIYTIYPRTTLISRKAVGKKAEEQIIATNIDFAFVVQAVDRDFNINRLERYLTLCHSAKIEPIIILNKADLINDTEREAMVNRVKKKFKAVPVILLSNETKLGFGELKKFIISGKTYCLLGSSGVGKSSLLNNLSEKSVMKTNTVSESTGKGQHVTSHRELILLKNGGVIIDNPGMREVGMTDSSGGIENTFNEIIKLSEKCRFKNCGHISEPGCAVLTAVKTGKLDKSSYENYLKLDREKLHYEMTIAEKHKVEKGFGKMVKHVIKTKRLNNQ